MTNKHKSLNSQVDEALANRDFNSIFEFLRSNSFSFLELLIFYKQRNRSGIKEKKPLFSFAEFWTSQLPHFHLEAIIESDLKVTFLESYFSANENCNPELNQHLLLIAKEDYIKHFKLWNAFKLSHFFDSFKQISKSDSEFEKIVKEFEIIIKSEDKIAKEEKVDEHYFLQFTFGEVILAFTLYYYEFKQDKQVAGNKSLQTKIEVTLVNELDRIIALFKGKSNLAFQFENNEDLQKYFHRNEAPHHILGKEGLILPLEEKFKLIYDLINRLIDRNSRRGMIQLYLCGYSNFESVILNPAPLTTNNSYRIFQINNAKSSPEELYFSKLRLDFSKANIPSKTDITSSIETLNFYGIPKFIEIGNRKVEIEKAIKLLKHFSVFKGPVERTPMGIMNRRDETFINLFGSNESVTLFEFDKFINGIKTYFNWNDEEANSILSFLTFDITANNFSNNWINKPFIKCNNQVLWLGSFLKDRRWDNIIINKLKNEPDCKSVKVKVETELGGNESKYISVDKFIPRNLELQIEKLFGNNSFKTLSGVRFSSSNGQTGDFDVLALKDNYLFVCEVKSGSRSDDFYYSSYLETVRLEGCAADQIEKSIFNIKEDWENIKRKMKIENEVNSDTLIIVPLIITDYFEGDMLLYKKVIRKISLLELDVIFKNKKKDLLELYELLKPITDSNNPNLNENRNKISKWDLWNGKKGLDIETLLENIDGNTIWKEIESLWRFDDTAYLIDY